MRSRYVEDLVVLMVVAVVPIVVVVTAALFVVVQVVVFLTSVHPPGRSGSHSHRHRLHLPSSHRISGKSGCRA